MKLNLTEEQALDFTGAPRVWILTAPRTGRAARHIGGGRGFRPKPRACGERILWRCFSSTGKPGWIETDKVKPYYDARTVRALRAVSHVQRPARDRVTVMINPIGTFLTHTDAALTGSMGGIISYMTSSMATPVTVSAIIYYAVQGLRLANGDPEPLDNFVPQLIRVGTVIWLSSNLSAFNQWVTNIFFTGLPNALATAIGNGTGNAPTGLNGTAAAFDNIWAQVWIILGNILGQASLMSATGVVALLAMVLVAVFGFGCLMLLVLVYECARLLLAVLVCLAPVIIGCALFDVTRPIFERAMGTVVSLILLQTAGLVVMQIVLMGDQWFVAQAVTASVQPNGQQRVDRSQRFPGARRGTADTDRSADVVLRRGGGDVQPARPGLLDRHRDHDEGAAVGAAVSGAAASTRQATAIGRRWRRSTSTTEPDNLAEGERRRRTV